MASAMLLPASSWQGALGIWTEMAVGARAARSRALQGLQVAPFLLCRAPVARAVVRDHPYRFH